MRLNGRTAALRDFVLHADRHLGSAINRAVCSHHRRRLERIGQLPAFEPPAGGWAAGAPPPRPGNALDVLIDGDTVLPRMVEAIAGATSHVHIAGWYFTPHFALTRGDEPTLLRDLLAEVAERVDVRVLVWSGAPLPLFRPTQREVLEMRERLTAGTRIRCAVDRKDRAWHCHHEKAIVIDDRVAFVGGIDLTTESGDRFDTSAHEGNGRIGWHDAAVRIEGPAVADVAEHFRLRWQDVTKERLAPPVPQEPAGEVEIQIVRTIPERVYESLPRGDFTILESYARALQGAQRLIYLESQFLWSPELLTILVDKLRSPPADDFRLLVVLPVRPNNGCENTRGSLGELVEADADGGRLLACTLLSRTGKPIYVHSKIGIVDDEWLTIGSANLNEHSLFNDTEVNVVVRDAAVARATRLALWAEHLELTPEEVAGDPVQLIEELWKPISATELERRQAGQAPSHRLVRLPHVSKHRNRLIGPLQGLLVDG